MSSESKCCFFGTLDREMKHSIEPFCAATVGSERVGSVRLVQTQAGVCYDQAGGGASDQRRDECLVRTLARREAR